MNESRLRNLTFSFHNSSRGVYRSLGTKNTNDTKPVNHLNNRRIIIDDNNLKKLFQQARSHEKNSTYQNEAYHNEVSGHTPVGGELHSVPINSNVSESNYIYKEPRKVYFDLSKNNSVDINNNLCSEINSNSHVIDGMAGWSPKSETTKLLLSKKNFVDDGVMNQNVDKQTGFVQESLFKTDVNTSSRNKMHTVNRVNDDLNRVNSGFGGSERRPVVNRHHVTVAKNNDEGNDYELFKREKRLVLERNNRKNVIKIEDSFQSLDAQREERRKNYEKEWAKKRAKNTAEKRYFEGVTHRFDVTDKSKSMYYNDEYSESHHTESMYSRNGNTNSNIHDGIRKLNFNQNQIISYYQNKYDLSEKQFHKNGSLRRKSPRSQDINGYANTQTGNISSNRRGGMYHEQGRAGNILYPQVITRSNSEELASSFDDGYSSGSNRTVFNEINDNQNPTESDFILSLTNKVNYGSDDIEGGHATSQQKSNTAPLSNVHDFLTSKVNGGVEESFVEPTPHHEEEQQRRQSIHSKLETLLQAKVQTLDKKKSKDFKTYRSLPNLYQTVETEKPVVNDITSFDYIDSSSSKDENIIQTKIPDASFNRTIEHSNADSAPSKNKTYTQSLFGHSEIDERHLNNKRSLISELTRTISKRQNTEKKDFSPSKLFDPNSYEDEQEPINDSINDSFESTNETNQTYLYDSFPLKVSPKHSGVTITPKTDSETNVANGIQDTDEQPIDKHAIRDMLKSHFVKKRANSMSASSRGTLGKMFSFTSMDMKSEAASDVSKQNMQMDNLYEKQLNPVVNKEDLYARVQHSTRTDGIHPELFTLTESDMADARKDLPLLIGNYVNNEKISISPENTKVDFPHETDAHNENQTQISTVPLSQSNEKFDFDLQQQQAKLNTETDIESKISQTDHVMEVENILVEERNISYGNLVSDSIGTQAEVTVSEGESSMLQPKSLQEVKIHAPISTPAPSRRQEERHQRRENSYNEHYLPENNDERVIKPSEFRVHKTKAKYRAPNPPQSFAEMKIDTHNVRSVTSSPLSRLTKHTASAKSSPSHQNREHQPMETDNVDFNFVSIDKKDVIRDMNGLVVNEKWSSDPYLLTNVGKLDIPRTFQLTPTEVESIKFQNSTTAVSTPIESPRGSAPKKIRRFSFGDRNDKIGKLSFDRPESAPNTSRSRPPTRIGNRFKQLFSPSSKKKLTKTTSMETMSSGIFSSDVSSWGMNDDASSLTGSLTGSEKYGEDDSIDTDFISNEEWIESHRSNESTNSNPSHTIPQIKTPMLPGWNQSKHKGQVTSNKNIGKVVVPDVFSKRNSDEVNMFQYKTRHQQQQINHDEKNKIKLMAKDAAFNSLDIVDGDGISKSYRQYMYSNHTPLVIDSEVGK